MKKFIIVIVIIVLVGGLGLWGPLNHGHFNHHTVMDEISHHDFPGAKHDNDDGQINEIDTAEFLKVHSTNPKIKSFFTQFRTPEITSFPCQNCHEEPLEKLQLSADNEKRSHWNIDLNHASLNVMSCTTCHHEDNLNMLSSLQGEFISIDNSFEMCGQCHSTQYKDWQGGAHGKNLSGWNSTRLVQTCVNCHDPHSPSIKPRWPSRLNKTESVYKQPN